MKKLIIFYSFGKVISHKCKVNLEVSNYFMNLPTHVTGVNLPFIVMFQLTECSSWSQISRCCAEVFLSLRTSMIGENRQLVTNESVEFEK